MRLKSVRIVIAIANVVAASLLLNAWSSIAEEEVPRLNPVPVGDCPNLFKPCIAGCRERLIGQPTKECHTVIARGLRVCCIYDVQMIKCSGPPPACGNTIKRKTLSDQVPLARCARDAHGNVTCVED